MGFNPVRWFRPGVRGNGPSDPIAPRRRPLVRMSATQHSRRAASQIRMNYRSHLKQGGRFFGVAASEQRQRAGLVKPTAPSQTLAGLLVQPSVRSCDRVSQTANTAVPAASEENRRSIQLLYSFRVDGTIGPTNQTDEKRTR